jgi:hypothetical protein
MKETEQAPAVKKEPRHEGFIASDDIGYDNKGGNSVTLEIESTAEPGTVTDAKKATVQERVLYFKKAEKGLILNRTNERILRLLCGRKPSGWIGKTITLQVRFTDAFGEVDIPTIRIIPPKGVPLPFGVRKWIGREKPTKTK